jgi:hypothetical protein
VVGVDVDKLANYLRKGVGNVPMRKNFIFLLILLLPCVLAVDDGILQATTVTSTVTISGAASLTNTGPKPELEYVSARLSNFPRIVDGQTVQDLTTLPVAQGSDILVFSWTERQPLNYQVSAKVTTTTRRPKVTTKVSFPYKDLPSDAIAYLDFTKHIDISPGIRAQAAVLANSDDAYEVIGNMASWIHKNVQYNLSTLTADVSQPSSWVFENRYGVCDEITSLFISMLRSVGIPAKYVSGTAYTNYDLFSERWVNHAWAEVYIPQYGWVPFDIAYGELGYVDATHIILSEVSDAATSAVSFEYQSRDLQLTTGELKTNVNVLQYDGQQQPSFEKKITVWKNRVSKDSWNVIVVTLKNNNPYYAMDRVYLANTDMLTLPENSWFILLPPYKEKRIYALVHVSPVLDDKYIYTFPVMVYDSTNSSAQAIFTAEVQGDFMDEQTAKTFLESPLEQTNNISCKLDQEILYVGETATITCTSPQPTTFCLDDQCTEGTFNYPASKVGAATIVIHAGKQNAFVPIRVSPLPNVTISDVSYPASMNYDEKGILRFTLEHDPLSMPRNIKVTLKGGVIDEQWNYTLLAPKETMSIAFTGRHLTKTKTPLVIAVSYQDARNNVYATQKTIDVQLKDVSFMERIELAFNAFGYWLHSLF